MEERRATSGLDRLVAGVKGAADDLELYGEKALPLVEARLRRIAAELETLSARDLLKTVS